MLTRMNWTKLKGIGLFIGVDRVYVNVCPWVVRVRLERWEEDACMHALRVARVEEEEMHEHKQ